jgi:hypothetical protein
MGPVLKREHDCTIGEARRENTPPIEICLAYVFLVFLHMSFSPGRNFLCLLGHVFRPALHCIAAV